MSENKVAAAGSLMLKSRPTITDRWGRKPCIIGGCLFMIVGGFVNTFSTSYGSELYLMSEGI
jgi:predicted MFS family arabinose efflux permease